MPEAKISNPVTIQQIETHPGWQNALRNIAERRPWLDRVHVEITEIPAPTFRESQRAEYMAKRLTELGLVHVRIDEAGNVIGERPGRSADFIALAAHLDTVVPAGIPIQVKNEDGILFAPGIGDNGAGLAALLGVASAINAFNAYTDLSLLFVCTAGEEGEGDLYGIRQLFAHKEFCRGAKAVIAIDGASIHRTATSALGSRRFLIDVSGPGGHSWNDFGRVNPINALAMAIARLGKLKLPTEPKATLNVGVIHGGEVVNSIPHSAWMKVDIRSTDPETINQLSEKLETTVREAVKEESQSGHGRLETTITKIGDRPASPSNPSARILQIFRDVDRHLGIKGRTEAASTDANIPLSLGIEAVTTGGGGSGGDAHTPEEWFDPQGRGIGIQRLALASLLLAGIAECAT